MNIAVCGMISSGKSTLTKNLASHLKLPLVEEFVEGDTLFEDLLDAMYKKKIDSELHLQYYFLTMSCGLQAIAKSKYTEGFIQDRCTYEHVYFAKHNLDVDDFKDYSVTQKNLHKSDADLHLILDIDWDTFKTRIFQRNRPQEIENFEINEGYFRTLLAGYVTELTKMLDKRGLKYEIINVNGLESNETLNKALQAINLHKSIKGDEMLSNAFERARIEPRCK